MTKKQNIDLSLILSNLVLMVCTIVLLGAVLYLNQKQIKTAALSDNRFLTTEWHLLQELKAQTDRLLQEKDLEISRLRAEYRNTRNQDLSPERVLALEAELKKAEEERAAILSSRLSAVVPASSPASPSSRSADAPAVADKANGAKPLTELLGERIPVLENQVAANRLRAEIAEKNLERYLQNSVKPPEPLEPPEATVLPVLPVLPESESSSRVAEVLLGKLEQKLREIGQEKPPDIEDIRTRSLLRAIVSSPAIRNEYPDLLESLDRYFTVFGRQERLTGQKEAYTFTIETLKTLESAKQE